MVALIHSPAFLGGQLNFKKIPLTKRETNLIKNKKDVIRFILDGDKKNNLSLHCVSICVFPNKRPVREEKLLRSLRFFSLIEKKDKSKHSLLPGSYFTSRTLQMTLNQSVSLHTIVSHLNRTQYNHELGAFSIAIYLILISVQTTMVRLNDRVQKQISIEKYAYIEICPKTL